MTSKDIDMVKDTQRTLANKLNFPLPMPHTDLTINNEDKSKVDQMV